MPTKKQTNYTKAFFIAIVVTIAVFILPRLLGALFNDNDWKSITGTVDGLSYIVIHPSWGKSIGIGATGWTIVFALIGAAIAGYSLGFGSQDQIHFRLGGTVEAQAKNESTVAIVGALVGLIISFAAWWSSAETAQQNTTYTVPAAQFDQTAAKKGKYDKEFHKYAQADPVRDKAFPPRDGLYK